MRQLVSIYLLLLLVSLSLPASAQSQREITPVEIDENKPQEPILHYYDKHGNSLKEPVMFLTELDTVAKVNPRPVYPLLNSVDVGLNFFDGFLMAFGQKHASIDAWGSLSLYNWFFPTLEAGVGFGSLHPEDGNYKYKAKPSLYIRAGLDYNFLYKSNPDYRAFVGFRAGFSRFSYDITDITINSPYWDQSNSFSLPGQTATSFYGQVVAGLRVHIYKEWSMGWTGRYNFRFNNAKGENSVPWFIPGSGATNRLTATFSIIYTIPLAGKSSERPGSQN